MSEICPVCLEVPDGVVNKFATRCTRELFFYLGLKCFCEEYLRDRCDSSLCHHPICQICATNMYLLSYSTPNCPICRRCIKNTMFLAYRELSEKILMNMLHYCGTSLDVSRLMGLEDYDIFDTCDLYPEENLGIEEEFEEDDTD